MRGAQGAAICVGARHQVVLSPIATDGVVVPLAQHRQLKEQSPLGRLEAGRLHVASPHRGAAVEQKHVRARRRLPGRAQLAEREHQQQQHGQRQQQ